MATLSKTPRTHTITLAASSSGPFDLPYRLFDDDAVSVYINGVATAMFRITANYVDGYDDNATVTLYDTQASGTIIQIDSDLNPHRQDDLINGPNLVSKLNIELGRIWSAVADIKRDTGRSVRALSDTSPLAFDAMTRAGSVLMFDDTGTGMQLGPTAAQISNAEAYAAAAAGYAGEAGRPYASRAEAQAATIPVAVETIAVLGPNREYLQYRRKPAGTIHYTVPLTTNAGSVDWIPLGPVFVQHWAENTIPGTTDMAAALEAAIRCVGGFENPAFDNAPDLDLLGQTVAISRTIYAIGARNFVLRNGQITAINGTWTQGNYREVDFDPATAVNTGSDVITVSGHGLSDGDAVRYLTNYGGKTAVGGLSEGSLYYVVNSTSSTFQVSSTSGGSAVNLTSVGTGTTHTFARDADFYGRPNYGLPLLDFSPDADGLSKVFDGSSVSAVDLVNDLLIIASHGFNEGDRVYYTTTGTAIGGLTDNQAYYVVNATDGTLQLEEGPGEGPVDLTSLGVGTTHTIGRAITRSYNVILEQLSLNGSHRAAGLVRFSDTQHSCSVVQCTLRAPREYGVLSTVKGGDLTILRNRACQFEFDEPGWNDPAQRTAVMFDIRTTDHRIEANSAFYCGLPLRVDVPGGTSEILTNKVFNGFHGSGTAPCAKIRSRSARILHNYWGPGRVDVTPDMVVITSGNLSGGVVIYSNNYHILENGTGQTAFVRFHNQFTGYDFSNIAMAGNGFDEVSEETTTNLDFEFVPTDKSGATATAIPVPKVVNNISSWVPASGQARVLGDARGIPQINTESFRITQAGQMLINGLPVALSTGSNGNFPTRFALTTYVADKIAAGDPPFDDGTIVTDGTVLYLSETGASDISDLPGLVPFGRVQPDHFGPNSTPGTTNVTTYMQSALTKGGSLALEGEAYAVTRSAASAFGMTAGSQITGKAGATIEYTTDTTGTSILFGQWVDGTLENTTINMTAGAGGVVGQMLTASDRLRIIGNTFDGGVTDDGVSVSHTSHVIRMTSVDAEDVLIEGNHFKNIGRLVQKSSDNTTTQTNLRFVNNTFEDYYSEAVALNAPSGTITGALFWGNVFRNGKGLALGLTNHAIGGANVKGIRAVGNFAYGTGGELFHFEEGTDGVSLVGNVGIFDNAQRGFFVADNDEGEEAGAITVTYNVSAITLSGNDPVVITTSAAHNYEDGDEVYFTGIGGTTELNTGLFIADVTSTTQFSLRGTDSANYTAFTSGGTVTREFRAVRNIAHVGNVYTRTTQGGDAGIDLAPNGSGDAPARYQAHVGNVVTNWARGIRMAESPHLNWFDGNVLVNNADGIQLVRPSLTVRSHLHINSTVGVETTVGGLIGGQQVFVYEGPWADGETYIKQPIVTSGTYVAGFDKGFAMQHRGRSLAVSTTNYFHIIPMGLRFHGSMNISVMVNSTNAATRRYDVDWDGSTLTATPVLFHAPTGNVNITGLTNDSGTLRVTVDSSNALSNVLFQLSFDGLYLSNA